MLRTTGERLNHLFSQDTIPPLRHSFAIPKLLYNLRTAPYFLSLRLQQYNNPLRSIVSGTVNIHLSEKDPAWIQAILPVKNGGLWLRSAVQLAPSTFLASATACYELISHILPAHLQSSAPTPLQVEAMTLWSRDHDTPPPDVTGQYHQKAWDSRRMTAIANKIPLYLQTRQKPPAMQGQWLLWPSLERGQIFQYGLSHLFQPVVVETSGTFGPKTFILRSLATELKEQLERKGHFPS